MRILARGQSDISIVCGESSAAIMGVPLEANQDSQLPELLWLDGNSKVVFFGLEGATDPKVYYK